MSAWLIYLALGAVAGVLAGMLGVGGGLIIVPVLAWWFAQAQFAPEYLMHLAIGSSLATIIVTALSSIHAHHRRGAVRWPLVLRLAPGIVLGVWAGSALAHHLTSTHLRSLFGVFELLVAVQMGFDLRPAAQRGLPGNVGLGIAGGVIGVVSALFGIGGGTLTVPFLHWCRVALREAVATSAACGLPIAIAGAVGFIVAGWGVDGLPDNSSGYVYWPAVAGIAATSVLFAPLGAHLAHSVPAALLRKVFAGFLVLVGLRMLAG